jgi:hypothetical protein
VEARGSQVQGILGKVSETLFQKHFFKNRAWENSSSSRALAKQAQGSGFNPITK